MGMIKIPQLAVDFFKINLDEIFQTGNLAEGKWNKILGDFVATFCNTRNAIPTSSNGSGLVALMLVYKTYFKKSEVLLQSNTMYGVKTMVNAAGCNLHGFIDCSLHTLMPSFYQVQSAILNYSGDRSKLIVLLSHIGGILNPDIEEIAEFCKSQGIALIEDCAHSFGSTLNKKHSGTFGDAGVFSFYATKSIPAGESGIIITNNDEIADYIRRFIIYDRFQQKMNIGNNNRPSEIQALFTYSVVKCSDEIIANKVEIANIFIPICTKFGIQYIEQFTKNTTGNYYKFIVYNPNIPISKFLPTLKSKTSAVYDYSLSGIGNIQTHHACLPIWYGQEIELTNKVVEELNASFK